MDFDHWFAKQSHPAEESQMLPDGVWEVGPGCFQARCCRCGRASEILCDLEDIPEVGYEHYCYGSDFCCP